MCGIRTTKLEEISEKFHCDNYRCILTECSSFIVILLIFLKLITGNEQNQLLGLRFCYKINCILKHALNLKSHSNNNLQPAARVTVGIGSTRSRSPTQTGSPTNRPKMNIVPQLHWTQKTVSGRLEAVLLLLVLPVSHQRVSWEWSTIVAINARVSQVSFRKVHSNKYSPSLIVTTQFIVMELNFKSFLWDIEMSNINNKHLFHYQVERPVKKIL